MHTFCEILIREERDHTVFLQHWAETTVSVVARLPVDRVTAVPDRKATHTSGATDIPPTRGSPTVTPEGSGEIT